MGILPKPFTASQFTLRILACHFPAIALVGRRRAGNGGDPTAELVAEGMNAIVAAITPGALSGDAYAAWREVARSSGLFSYERHHCGYLVGIGFPPSWTGGSKVTGLAPDSKIRLQVGMVLHLHSWFTNTDCADYFTSNTAMLTENGCELLTTETPQTLMVR